MDRAGPAATPAAPPARAVGPLLWLRERLFSSWSNAALTLLALWLVYQLVSTLFTWGVLHATWQGRDGGDCREGGACWPFVGAWFGTCSWPQWPS